MIYVISVKYPAGFNLDAENMDSQIFKDKDIPSQWHAVPQYKNVWTSGIRKTKQEQSRDHK